MSAFAKSLNILFPPQCGLCREATHENGGICATCWQELNFITAPFCGLCGYPHEFDMGEGAECAQCIANPPEYHGHRSIFHFDKGSKRLVHDLKYYDKSLMLDSFANWLELAAKDWLDLQDVLLVPVPIHRWRLLKRKYNQSALLVKALAKHTQAEYKLDAILRVKNRPPQASLSRQMRLKNLGGTFKINSKRQDVIKARPIILIDDVMTTGATINACAKALKKAGSGRVFSLTLARTVLD